MGLKELGTLFASWGLTVDLAEWASIYLIYEAKRRFGGVGGKTHTFVMRSNGQFSYGLRKNIREKEELLDTFVMTNQLFMLSLDPSVRESKAKDFVGCRQRRAGCEMRGNICKKSTANHPEENRPSLR